MKFGGIQKVSTIDYPGGLISCVVFTIGCNFRCDYCHNPELVCNDHKTDLNLTDYEVLNYLANRINLIDGVVISGGEPTLHKNLSEFCSKLKKMGFYVKLDTNGSSPDAIIELIDNKLVDYIAMDIKTDINGYKQVWKKSYDSEKILNSIKIIMNKAKAYEFRTTFVKPMIDNKVIENIGKIIKGADIYVMQKFKLTKVLNEKFFKEADRQFTDNELKNLRIKILPYVKQCIIR